MGLLSVSHSFPAHFTNENSSMFMLVREARHESLYYPG